MKYLTRTFRGKKERVSVDIKDIEFMYLEAKFPITKIAEAYMVTYAEMSRYIYCSGLKDKRYPKNGITHDVSVDIIFEKFIEYIKTIFGSNMIIKRIDSVTGIINDRWKFEWHKGFEKSAKRFIDTRDEMSDIKVNYKDWMSEVKYKNGYVAQYEMDGEFVRLWDSESDICTEYGFSYESLYYARLKDSSLCGYRWRKVSDISVQGIDSIDTDDIVTKELLIELYINQGMSVEGIADRLKDKDMTYNKVRNRLLKYGIIGAGKINNKVSYKNGGTI